MKQLYQKTNISKISLFTLYQSAFLMTLLPLLHCHLLKLTPPHPSKPSAYQDIIKICTLPGRISKHAVSPHSLKRRQRNALCDGDAPCSGCPAAGNSQPRCWDLEGGSTDFIRSGPVSSEEAKQANSIPHEHESGDHHLLCHLMQGSLEHGSATPGEVHCN